MPKKIRRKKRGQRLPSALDWLLAQIGPRGRTTLLAVQAAGVMSNLELMGAQLDVFGDLVYETCWYELWIDDARFIEAVEPQLEGISDVDVEALFVEVAASFYDLRWRRATIDALAAALESDELDADAQMAVGTAVLILATVTDAWTPHLNAVCEVLFCTQFEEQFSDEPFLEDMPPLTDEQTETLRVLLDRVSRGDGLPVLTEDERQWLLAEFATQASGEAPAELEAVDSAPSARAGQLVRHVVQRLERMADDERFEGDDRALARALTEMPPEVMPMILLSVVASPSPIVRHESERRFVEALRDGPEPETLAEYRSWLLARGEDLTAIDGAIELYTPLEPDDDAPNADDPQLRLF